MEEYRQMTGYDDEYRISSKGRVSVKRKGIWRDPTPLTTSDGKLSVLLSRQGKELRRGIHMLVAEHFLEGPKGSLVKHINGNVTDNRVENLKWAHRGSAGMTSKDVQSIRQIYEEQGVSQKSLAERYNVSPMTIHNIITRKTWKHVE